MGKLFTENDLTYYKKDDVYYSYWGFGNLTDESLRDAINNHIVECTNDYPFKMFQVSKFRTEKMNISLWEYLKLYKNESDIPDALKSAFLQDSNYDGLIIACESFDCTSEVTRDSMKIIYKYVNMLEQELLELTKKEYIEVEVY